MREKEDILMALQIVETKKKTAMLDLFSTKPNGAIYNTSVSREIEVLDVTAYTLKWVLQETEKTNSKNTNMYNEDIAQVAHEINRAYCASIGDNSQPSWADAPEWQKSAAINGVQFHLDNPDASPSASHQSWLKQKTEEGWKYGPVKNPETKEHPCYVPYDELPTEQKSKDFLFKQVIHSLKRFIRD